MVRINRQTFAVLGGGILTGAVATRQVGRYAGARQIGLTGTAVTGGASTFWARQLLNAAYFDHPDGERDLESLRLAQGILNTWWHRHDYGKVRLWDVPAFDRAFDRRLALAAAHLGREPLSYEELLAGAGQLLGNWFPDAWHDDARRAWGIAFETTTDRDTYQPERRVDTNSFGPLAPPRAPEAERTWHTYPPVPGPSADGLIDALRAVERWADYASALGVFTATLRGPLLSQTFETELLEPVPNLTHPIRAYVSVTQVLGRERQEALDAHVAALNEAVAAWGEGDTTVVPTQATACLALDLTAHMGHFLGRARETLVVYEQDSQAFIRSTGTWDPLPPRLKTAYEGWGKQQQEEFWGVKRPEHSMLCRLALAAG